MSPRGRVRVIAKLKGRRLRFYVGVSLALHAAVLLLPRPAREHLPGPPSPVVGRVHLRLTPATAATEGQVPRVSIGGAGATAPSSSPRRSNSEAKREAREAAQESDRDPHESNRVVPISPPQEAGSSLDVEGMRQQARGMRTEQQRAPGWTAERPSPGADALDRPALEALARRLGQPVEGAREEVLADGSRRIRFSGGTCLNIPRHLPLGRENTIGPTLLLPETCPRAGR